MALALVLHQLGAGRSKAGEPVNHSVGVELLVSLGQQVQKGEERSEVRVTPAGTVRRASAAPSFPGAPWLRLHHEDPAPSQDQISRLQSALMLGAQEDGRRKTLVAELLLPQEFMK